MTNKSPQGNLSLYATIIIDIAAELQQRYVQSYHTHQREYGNFGIQFSGNGRRNAGSTDS